MSAHGREALRLWQKDVCGGKAAEAGDLLAPGKETRQLWIKSPFHACSYSSLLEWNCPFPKCTHSHLSPPRCKPNGAAQFVVESSEIAQ